MLGVTLSIFATAQAALALTTVKVAFVEALAPRDTTSSARFQKDYDLAISIGRKALEKRLRTCGYALETETVFYDASDPLQAKERGTELERKDTWLIVGPRRSNHYMLLAQGAAATATLSLMASASGLNSLGPKHISISPLNTEMARSAANEIKKRLKNISLRTYISVVSKDCAMCVDFASVFDAEAKKLAMKKIGEYDVVGDEPDTSSIESFVRDKKPAIILVPNFSKVASLLMARLAPINSSAYFVGGDGWGETYGFVNHASGIALAKGISIRGFPPFENGLKQFRLGRELKTEKDLPKSTPALGILKSLDGLTEMLCRSHADTRNAFADVFAKNGKKMLGAPWGTNVYELNNGSLSYLHRARGESRSEK